MSDHPPAATPAILVLDDGRRFRGWSFGAPGETAGAIVVATGVADYQATLTAPDHRHKIVVATSPHIGNTGWDDGEGVPQEITAAGYVVRDPAPRPASGRTNRGLHEELRRQGIVGIAGVDTRALVRHLRERGTAQATISTTVPVPALPVDPAAPHVVADALANPDGEQATSAAQPTAPRRRAAATGLPGVADVSGAPYSKESADAQAH